MLQNILDKNKEIYHQKKGLKNINSGDYKKALHHFEKAILINSDHTNNFHYSICLIALNRFYDAIQILEKIDNELDDDIIIMTLLVDCYLTVRYWDKAIQVLNILEKKVDNPFFKKMYSLAHDEVKRENYALGKESFFSALDYAENNDFDSAFIQMRRAIALYEENPKYYYLLATFLEKGKKDKEGIEYYIEKAIKLAPDNETYKKYLQYIKTKYKSK